MNSQPTDDQQANITIILESQKYHHNTRALVVPDLEFLRHVGNKLFVMLCVNSDDTVILQHASSSSSAGRKAQSPSNTLDGE